MYVVTVYDHGFLLFISHCLCKYHHFLLSGHKYNIRITKFYVKGNVAQIQPALASPVEPRPRPERGRGWRSKAVRPREGAGSTKGSCGVPERKTGVENGSLALEIHRSQRVLTLGIIRFDSKMTYCRISVKQNKIISIQRCSQLFRIMLKVIQYLGVFLKNEYRIPLVHLLFLHPWMSTRKLLFT